MIEEFIDLSKEYLIRGYRLAELLERETVTTLYRALTEELWLPPEVMIRLVHIPETFSEPIRKDFIERFLYEARRIVRLRHFSLSPLFGYGEQNGLLYLLMPNMQGETLAHRLGRQPSWSVAEAFTLLAPLASALEYIHSQGLVHQFLHPGNILLPEGAPPQITRLNLAQLLSRKGIGLPSDEVHVRSYAHLMDISGAYAGSAEYLAPEVVKGLASDPRSDVYSLGVLLFTLLCGQPPFSGQEYLEIAQKHTHEPLPSLQVYRPDVPVALEIMLNRALHRNPRRRFQTPREFIAAYSHLMEEQGEDSSHDSSTLAQVQSLPFPVITIDSPLWQYQQTFSHTPSLEPPIPLSTQDDMVKEAWLNSEHSDPWLSQEPEEEDTEEEPETQAEEESGEVETDIFLP